MAASKQLDFKITKDNLSRSLQSASDGPPKQGSGGDRHWVVGRVKDSTASPDRWDEYFVNAQATYEWKGVGRVLSAELQIRATEHHIGDMGNAGIVYIRPISPGADTWSEGNRGEDDFGSDEYRKPNTTDTPPRMKSGALQPGILNAIDVMSLVQWHAPTSVLFRIGGEDVPGRNKDNRGFRVYSSTPETASRAVEFWGSDASTAGNRPVIHIVYEPRSTKPVASLVAPSGSVSDAPTFSIQFLDDDADQMPSSYELQVRPASGGDSTWKIEKRTTSDAEKQARVCQITAPAGKWKIGAEQEWRAKVWDDERTPIESDWTAWGSPFTVTGGAPTIETVESIGTVSSMAAVHFVATWDHPQDKGIASWRIQLRTSTIEGSPLWEGGDNEWDTGDVTPTTTEQTARRIDQLYGGASLLAGDYSWRIKVIDGLGVSSAWGYGTLDLTADYDVADPGAGDQQGFGQRALGTRIILRAMGDDRGPGAIRAVIEDASNVGASAYVSAPGELYFTLPATHPQVGECEPYRTHYSLEQYRNGKWQEMFAGILTDFDATGDDAVINGMDYIGLLSLDIERRSWSKPAAIADPKYNNKTISYIIRDQLEAARDLSNSTTGFITIPPSGPKFQTMANEIVIDGSFRQRLEFIRGLIDSQRAGTGSRARLVCRRVQGSTADETHGYSYEWNLLLDSGVDRPALRMEYGGLIQGFRIQAMGDFAVQTLAIGRKTEELKPFYKTATAPNLSPSYWGNLAKVAVWQDMDDENDLARRANQLAAESGRIGKRMALGLRVHGLAPYDGWDLTDSVPIDIVRGAVDTGHFAPDPPESPTAGLSWWTIWGTEYRISPDGHDELTLVVRPREDTNEPDPDLIVAKPAPGDEDWQVGVGPPPNPAVAPFAPFYLDSSTGDIYILDTTVDPPVYVLSGSIAGADLDPPGTVTDVDATSSAVIQPDGTVVVSLSVTWVPPADLDLSRYEIHVSTQPDFLQRRVFVAPHESPYALIVGGVTPDIQHFVRVRAVDTSNNVGELWSDTFTITPSGDIEAPEVPVGLTAIPGYRLVGLSWPYLTEPDFSHYGVRWTTDPGDPAAPVGPDWEDEETTRSTTTRSSMLVIQDLDPDSLYWFQLRSVDTSNQTMSATGAAVDADQNQDEGWASAVSAQPWYVGVTDLVLESLIVEDFLKTGTLDASAISTGTLTLGTPGVAPILEVRDSRGYLIGRWDHDGVLLIDPDVKGRALWMQAGELRVTNALKGGDPDNSHRDPDDPFDPLGTDDPEGPTVWTASVTAEGINAGSIRWGIGPGGHNAIPNSGFELTAFSTTTSTKTWTVAADWGAGVFDVVNIDTASADLPARDVHLMPTRDFPINKEQSVAEVGGANRGSGGDSHLPIGKSSFDGSYVFRGLQRFANDWSGMGQVTKIEWHGKLTGEVHTEHGGSRRVRIQRLDEAFTEAGGGENSWGFGHSGSVGFAHPTTSGTVDEASLTAWGNGDWVTIDITDSYDNLIPSSVLNPAGTPGQGDTNYGIRIWSEDEGAVSRTAEFWGKDSGFKPYVRVTYTVNSAPSKPVPVAPVGGTTFAPSTAIDFDWTGTDPDVGDSLASYDLQVGTDATFAATLYSGANLTAGSVSGFNVTNAPYPGGTLPATGVPLYWRVRNKDAAGAYSAWSDPGQFAVGALPSVSSPVPAASGLARIHNLDALAIWTSGGAHAKPEFQFIYQSGASRPMNAYRLRIWNSSSVQQWDSTTVAHTAAVGASVEVKADYAIVNGTLMKWGVEVRDIDGNWSAAMALQDFRVRWGQAIHTHNVGAGAVNLRYTPGSLSGGSVQMTQAFRSADNAAGSAGATNATAWVKDIGLVTPVRAYIHILTRLASSTSGNRPALADMALESATTGTARVPDRWAVASGTLALDSSRKRFGEYSAKLTGSTTDVVAKLYPFRFATTDGIAVSEDTDYVFSVFVNTNGALGGTDRVSLTVRPYWDATTAYALTPPNDPGNPTSTQETYLTSDSSAFDDGWQRLAAIVHVPLGVTSVSPQVSFRPASAGQTIWVDGAKFEEGRVVTNWAPGFVGSSGVIDASGVQIDASTGGIFRLRGSAGGARDFVELGANGLNFGGATSPVNLYSPGAHSLHVSAPVLDYRALVDVPTPPANMGTLHADPTGSLYWKKADGSDAPVMADDVSGALNMLTNGGFRDGLSSWTFSSDGNSTWSLYAGDDTTWTLADGDRPGWVPGSTTLRGSTAYVERSAGTAAALTSFFYQDVPATAGQWYSASALIAMYGFANASIYLDFRDLAGAETGAAGLSLPYPTPNVDKTKANEYSDYYVATINAVQAPANTRRLRFYGTTTTPTTYATAWAGFDQMWVGVGKTPRRYVVVPPLTTGSSSGAAGGVLAGNYPNPGFAADMATQAELNAHAATAHSSGGAAGGVLSGVYPNPGFAVDMATQAELDTEVTARTTADTSHAAAADSHTGYQKESEKDANSGYVGLSASQGTRTGAKFLRDDGTWQTVAGGGGGGAPTGPAGGVLAGDYPNPTFAADMATQVELNAHAATPHSGGGAPTDATYLVATAHASLTNEVPVGASPGGELLGSWSAPTVAGSHSGSTHASIQAAAEATVGLGSAPNMLKNGGFRDGLACWTVYNDIGAYLQMLTPDHSYALADGDIPGWTPTGTMQGSTAYFYRAGTPPGIGSVALYQRVPANAGEYYSASGLLGVHKFTHGGIQIDFYNAAGVSIGGGALATVGQNFGLGAAYNNWGLLTINGVLAPPNTKSIFFNVYGIWNGGTAAAEPYLFMDQYWLGVGKVAHRYQPPVPDYQDGVIRVDGNSTVHLKNAASTGAGIFYDGPTQPDRFFAGMQSGTDSTWRVWSTGLGQNVLALDDTGRMSLPGGGADLSGAGSPEGVVAANRGALYLRTDGGPTSTLYVKTSGSPTSTGWTAK